MAPNRLVTAGNQSGKALRNGSKILTTIGWRTIESIAVGDVVFDGRGRKTTVLGVYPQGILPIYRVTFDDEVFVDCTEDHLWKIIPRKWRSKNRSKTLSLRSMLPSYKRNQPKSRHQIQMVSSVQFPKRKVAIDPYFMGVLLGDGHFPKNGVSFSTADRQIVRYVENLGFKLKKVNRYDYRVTFPRGIGNHLLQKIRACGLSGKLSFQKFIPENYLYNTDHVRLHILRGLMDTDGSSGQSAEFCSTSKILAEQVVFLAQSFGAKAEVRERTTQYTYKGERKKGRLSYRVRIKSPNKNIFSLKRKAKIKYKSFRTKHRVIRSIEFIGYDDATCVRVASPEATFLTNGLVVTHNTTLGAYEHICYALGEHPYKDIIVPNTGFIVTAKPLREGIEKDVMPKIKSLVGSHDILNIKPNPQGTPYKIIWRGGSVSFLMSAEQEDVVFEGTTINHAWLDEPMRRSIFVAIRRGMLTTGGHVWMTCTPLDEPWIYDEIYLPGVSGKDPAIEVFEGSSDQNPHISAAEKQAFLKILTADEIEARWHGKFRHLSGRVFKSYLADTHRIDPFDIPHHWPVWVAIDPHKRKPHAVLFWATSPQGIHYICNEIYLDCSIKKLGEHIKEIESQYQIVDRLIDTSSQEDDWSKDSAREILQVECNLTTKLAQKKNLKTSGIILLNQLFNENKLFVFRNCVRMHRELTLQTYKKSRDSQMVLEEPEKKWDDMTDNARYIVVERPTYGGVAQIYDPGRLYERA